MQVYAIVLDLSSENNLLNSFVSHSWEQISLMKKIIPLCGIFSKEVCLYVSRGVAGTCAGSDALGKKEGVIFFEFWTYKFMMKIKSHPMKKNKWTYDIDFSLF